MGINELEEYFSNLPFEIDITSYARKLTRENNSHIFAIYGHCYNNSWYIGQTSEFRNIIKRFGSDGNRYLAKNRFGDYNHPKFARALAKYGWKSFSHYILGFYPEDKINKAEKYWISKKNAYNAGYNSNCGGQSPVERLPHSQKISESLKGHLVSNETRKKISNSLKNSKKYKPRNWFRPGKENPMYGKHVNYIENLGGVKYGKENFFFGKTHSDAAKTKIAESLSKRKYNPESIEKMKESLAISNERLKIEKKEYPERFIGNAKPVAIIDENGKILKKFRSSTAAEKAIGVSRQLISACAAGKSYSAGGYRWKYILAKEVEDDI